jgi:hypothetical protein
MHSEKKIGQRLVSLNEFQGHVESTIEAFLVPITEGSTWAAASPCGFPIQYVQESLSSL